MTESLPAEQQTKVMTEIGRLRQRTFAVVFGISWPITFACLLLGLGLGIVPNLIVSSFIAGALSRTVVRTRRGAIIRSVLTANGISADVFDPAKYIIG